MSSVTGDFWLAWISSNLDIGQGNIGATNRKSYDRNRGTIFGRENLAKMRRLICSRIDRHPGGRKTGRVCAQLFVWRVAHLQFERPAVDYVGVADPDLVDQFRSEE